MNYQRIEKWILSGLCLFHPSLSQLWLAGFDLRNIGAIETLGCVDCDT